jgi:2-polyprenyl-6-methoxyphenol hydroxylase-like FAD-dependent oxidoreductase
MQDRSVLISGAGIAGPTVAYWLARLGYRPTLVEQSPHLRRNGYVIDFWGLGFDVADRMGLVPAIRRHGYDVEKLTFVDANGRRSAGFDTKVFRRLTDGRYVSIARADLAALIYEALDERCETIFGDTITRIDQNGEGVEVAFEHGPDRRFDFVIGADGLHSTVRRLVFGPQERFEKHLGYGVAAFEIEGYRPRDEGIYVSFSAPARQIARFALDGDRTLILFVFAANGRPDMDGLDLAGQKQLLLTTFADAGWECGQILKALQDCDDLYFDRVSQIRMDSWALGRVVLLGDAAFCPSLLAGQGSALAMTAGYVLAGELGRGGGPEAAFARYESLLHSFLVQKQKAAEGFASSFVPRTRLGIFVRNQVTNALAVPFIARFIIGRGLLDDLELPDYTIP